MKKKWFTLIEMLVVVVVIGTLSATIVPRIWNSRERANDTARMSDILTIASALSSYIMDHPSYPDVKDASELTWLLREDYWLGWAIPRDPKTLEPYSYKVLDGGKHFIICATLSESSTAGNSKYDYAATIKLKPDNEIITKTGGGRRSIDNGTKNDDGNSTKTIDDGTKSIDDSTKNIDDGSKGGGDSLKDKIIDKDKIPTWGWGGFKTWGWLPDLKPDEIEKIENITTYEDAVSKINDKWSYYCYAH